MINLFILFRKKTSTARSRQQMLLDFVNDEQNTKKAAEGSMNKRIELIDRVLNKQAV